MSNPLYPYASDEIQRLLYYIANNTADLDAAGGGGSSLPSQAGQSGKYLTTNGTTASWGALSGGGNVTGPGSAVSGNFASFNGTSGTTIQDSGYAFGSFSLIAGSSSIVTVGTITTGTWHGTAIGAAYGGTGVGNNAANTITFSGNYGLTMTLSNTTSVTLPTSGTLATTAVATLSSLTSIGTIGTGVWQGTVIANTYGGTGASSAASTGVAQVASGTWSWSTALASGTTATTQATNDSSTKVATTAYVTPATHAVGTVTTSAAFDWSVSTSFTVVLTATDTCVATFSNTLDGETITIAVTTASTAAVTWPTVAWTGAAGAPTQSTTGNVDFYTFKKVGTVIYGAMVANMG